ncbi:hypothetical protein J6TS2_26880 [Heyndrickxia sporothermodurans]|nr:hypothetical protein J6TS2_26880 [Heyndrickxia sporothermodurans]
MDELDIGSIITYIIGAGLLLLCGMSFALFIRKLLVNSAKRAASSNQMEEKLDQILELLEKEKETK